MKKCSDCKYEMSNNCYKDKVCIDYYYFEKKEYSSVEIGLFNHKTSKVLYENLTMEQLEHILKVLDPKGWI